MQCSILQQKNCWTMNQCICVLSHHVQHFTHSLSVHYAAFWFILKELTCHWGRQCGQALKHWNCKSETTSSILACELQTYFRSSLLSAVRRLVQSLYLLLSCIWGDAQYTKSIYTLLCCSSVWILLCYCVRARDHCCVLCDIT